MTKIKRGFCVLLISIIMLSALPLQAQVLASDAAVSVKPSEPMMRWSNISDISLSLSISSGTATCSGSIIGHPGTTKIVATFSLQLKNSDGTFSTVKTWPTQTTYEEYLTFSETYPVSSGKTYRFKCVAAVTRNGTTESAIVYSSERKA